MRGGRREVDGKTMGMLLLDSSELAVLCSSPYNLRPLSSVRQSATSVA
jgi:hypothetical protein